MSVVIDGQTYDYDTGKYVPGYNRLFDTKRTLTGEIARVDTSVIERTYDMTLFCQDRDQLDILINSYFKKGTVPFIDDRGTVYDAYFMNSPLRTVMSSPVGFIPCNQYTVDVTLMVNAQT